MTERRSVLLLCRKRRDEARNVADHIGALISLSRHDVRSFDPFDRPDAAALLDLDEFDAVVIHYTLAVVSERYLPEVLAGKIARYRGLKVQFIQDEYRWVDTITARIRDLGVNVLFTCVPEREVRKVYGDRVPGLRTIGTLPGFVPDELAGVRPPPLAGRSVDVGYRGRSVPFWLGRLAYEKEQIGDHFLERCSSYGLRCDISSAERDRIYGAAWKRFLGACRTTLGTESGASIADYDGSIEARVRHYLVRHAGASFEEVERELLEPFEGNVVINTVSPRVFEAAALRTALILFPGEYSGTVEPWTHYIPLEKDFSNMDEVVGRIRDTPFLVELTERAHADLVASGRYSLRRLVEQFDEIVADAAGGSRREKRAYRRAVARRRVPSLASSTSRVRSVVGKAAQPAVMTALVVHDAAVRDLARRAHRNVVTDRGRLAADLWRLAALRRGVRQQLFGVDASLEEGGRRLVLMSTPAPGGDGGAASDAAVRGVLGAGTLTELIWDHSALGAHVPLLADGLLPTFLGHHGVTGAYAFGPLVELARAAPEAVLAALGPVLVQGPRATALPAAPGR